MKCRLLFVFALLSACQPNQGTPSPKPPETTKPPKQIHSFIIGKETPDLTLTADTPNPNTLPSLFGAGVPNQKDVQTFGEGGEACPDMPANQTGKVALSILPTFTENGVKKVFVKTIFTSTALQPEELNCHSCGPVFGAALYAYTNSQWTIVAQNKCLGGSDYGNWGAAPDAWLLPIGPERHALAYQLSWSAQGINFHTTQLAAPFENDKTIRFIFGNNDDAPKSESNPGAVENPADPGFYAYEARMDLIPANSGDYFDIVVTTLGTKPNENDNTIKPVQTRQRFQFDGKTYKILKE